MYHTVRQTYNLYVVEVVTVDILKRCFILNISRAIYLFVILFLIKYNSYYVKLINVFSTTKMK